MSRRTTDDLDENARAEYRSRLTGYETEIEAGGTYTFGIETMPMTDPDGYRDHVDQPVTVLKHLEDGVDYDGEGTRHLVRVRAEDGWEGEIWDYELEPAAARGEGAPPDNADVDQVPGLAG